MNTTTVSPAAQVIVALIPIVGIFIGGVIVFFSLLWHHHEIKQQVKMGTYRREAFNLKAFSLLFGVLLSVLGVILTLFFALMKGCSPALLGGLVPLAIGISLVIFYAINPDFKRANEG
ncbi:MAG: hypothetical protein K6G80_07130 [Treponema sp.]|nr:hypothetical protein [Treponema sp.]